MSDQPVAKAATYTAHTTKSRTSIPSAGFKPAIPVTEQLQVCAGPPASVDRDITALLFVTAMSPTFLASRVTNNEYTNSERLTIQCVCVCVCDNYTTMTSKINITIRRRREMQYGGTTVLHISSTFIFLLPLAQRSLPLSRGLKITADLTRELHRVCVSMCVCVYIYIKFY